MVNIPLETQLLEMDGLYDKSRQSVLQEDAISNNERISQNYETINSSKNNNMVGEEAKSDIHNHNTSRDEILNQDEDSSSFRKSTVT